MNAIETSGLSKTFKKMYAVNDLNLTVPEGSIYGFIGKTVLVSPQLKNLSVAYWFPRPEKSGCSGSPIQMQKFALRWAS